MKKWLSAVLSLAVVSSSLLSTPPLAAVGLEDAFLGGIPVVVVSRRAESIEKTPGVVSVLTAQDIQNLGVQSTAEALRYLPGIVGYDTVWGQVNQFAIRGNYDAGNYNTQILFLVNGHPTYMAISGAFEVNSIPVDAIERIEVVRGPVSVLYGTNALAGAINVVTKKKVEGGRVGLTYQSGSFRTQEGRLSVSDDAGDFRYFASATLRDQKGYRIHVTRNQSIASTPYSKPFWEDYRTYFLSAAYKRLEVDISYWYEDFLSKAGSNTDTRSYLSAFDQQHGFADVRYKQPLGNGGSSLNFVYRYDLTQFDYSRLDGTAQMRPTYNEAYSRKMGGEIYLDMRPTEKLDLVLGGLYDRYYKIDWVNQTTRVGVVSKRDIHLSDTAGYLKVGFQALERVRLTGGARNSYNSRSHSHADFQVGAVTSLRSDLTLKTLYGSSYRAANATEYFFNSNTIRGNDGLKPETLKGLDISLHHSRPSVSTALSYFYNRTGNEIIRVPIAPTIRRYENFDKVRTQGVELEVKAKPFSRLEAFGNASRIIDNKNLASNPGINPITPMKTTGSVGLVYTMLDGRLRLSNSNIFIGRWEKANNYAISNLAAFLGLPGGKERGEVFVKVTNVFDRDFEIPQITQAPNDKLRTLPGVFSRAVMFGVQMSLF